MNKILEIIYNDYTEKLLSDNLLETPETKEIFDSFFDTYFGQMTFDEYDKAYFKIIDVITAYQERAFETGFYAGIELMK